MSTHNASPDYLRMILERTYNDKQLALTIVSQLCAELPAQLDAIHHALSEGQYEHARQVVHKLHGSLGICGLENMRENARHLERCLVDKNYGVINRYWFQLQQCAFDFAQQQQTLLADLS